MSIAPEYVYDEEKTRQYINRELKKLYDEKAKKLAEYNNLISEFNNYNKSIANISFSYKEAFKKVSEIGSVGGLVITDSETLLDSSKSIDELIVAVNGLISQIGELIKKYYVECDAREYKIRNHKEYKIVSKDGGDEQWLK